MQKTRFLKIPAAFNCLYGFESYKVTYHDDRVVLPCMARRMKKLRLIPVPWIIAFFASFEGRCKGWITASYLLSEIFFSKRDTAFFPFTPREREYWFTYRPMCCLITLSSIACECFLMKFLLEFGWAKANSTLLRMMRSAFFCSSLGKLFLIAMPPSGIGDFVFCFHHSPRSIIFFKPFCL